MRAGQGIQGDVLLKGFAMSFREYWDKLRARNAALHNDDTKMTITVASFRAQVKKAFEAGAEAEGEQKGGMDGLFEAMFGKRKS